MTWPLDPRSKRHARVFFGQVGFLLLFGSPSLLIDSHPPVLFFLVLRKMFGLTALALLAVGLLSTRRTPGAGLGPWDHCLAFVLLALGCSIALRLLQ